MAGKKGRSGRRPLSVEQKHLAIIDKAWEVVGIALNDPDLTIMDKVMIAEKVVSRDIARKVFMKGEGFGDSKIIIVNQKDKKPEQVRDTGRAIPV
jgi:hypothetical protein